MTMTPWEYKAIALSVHDGDTFTVRLDLGDRIFRELEVRVAGINAPELRVGGKPNPEGYAARDELTGLLDASPDPDRSLNAHDTPIFVPQPLMVRTHRTPNRGDEESFTRYVADVELPGGVDLATKMLSVPGVVPLRHPVAA